MDIRFVSSLTPEDEIRLAQALLSAFAQLLDQVPITYTLKIEVSGCQVFHHSHSPEPVIGSGEDASVT